MGKRAAALLALGLGLALAPLSPAAPRSGGTFLVAEPAQYIDSIDAAVASGAGNVGLAAACASLMRVQDKPLPAGFRVAPELAAGPPKISADGKTYVFTIRKDARFSTGAPVTAADVAHTIDRALNPSLKWTNSGAFQSVVGAQEVLAGKATSVAGISASSRTLTIRLTRPDGGFVENAASSLCVVPASTPMEPLLAAPIPSAAPYFVSEYVPSQRLVLERNPFYKGPRPQNVDRIVFDLTVDENGAIDDVLAGKADYAWVPNIFYAPRAPELARRFGVNKSQFFVEPSTFLRMFVLNTSRPLLRDNVPLRQAINYGLDRAAAVRLDGPYAGTPTDQFLPPILPGFVDARLYPLVETDVAKAKALAKGHLRGGRLVLYVPTLRVGLAQLVKSDLARIGLHVEIESFPPALYFNKLATRTEPFDMGFVGWNFGVDPGTVLPALFDGTTIGTPGNANWSYFDAPRWNRALKAASRLTGEARYRAFGRLDVQIARDAAPAVAYGVDNTLTLVSARTGCVIVNPALDLAAVCLK
jgi:peptide/nickel transport system substrate-binding protein